MNIAKNSSPNLEAVDSTMKSYEETQQYAQKHQIKNMRMWFDFHNVRKGGHVRDKGIPGDPSKYFGRRGLWLSWPSFLGTDTVATNVIAEGFLDLEGVKAWFVDNKIYTAAAFRDLCAEGKRPVHIPSAPNKKFSVKYSELLCPKPRPYLEFKEARDKVIPHGFKSYLEFRQYRRDNMEEMKDVPCNPDKIYDNEGTWTSWPNFLGYSRIGK